MYVVGDGTESLRKEGIAAGPRSWARNGVSKSGFGKPAALQVSGAQRTERRPWELAAGVAVLEEQGQGHNWTPESRALPRVWSRVPGASVTAASGATAVATHALGSWRLGSERSIREQVLPMEALCEALMREEAAISSLISWADPYESSLLWGGRGSLLLGQDARTALHRSLRGEALKWRVHLHAYLKASPGSARAASYLHLARQCPLNPPPWNLSKARSRWGCREAGMSPHPGQAAGSTPHTGARHTVNSLSVLALV